MAGEISSIQTLDGTVHSIVDNTAYHSSYTGTQIDGALAKVINADATPTSSSANMVTSGGVKSAIGDPVFVFYIEPTFVDGIASYDMSAKLAQLGKTTMSAPICQMSGSAAMSSPCVRACDMSGNTLKIGLTSASYNGTVGVFVHARLT